MEKIFIAVQDVLTLAARTRPDCADAHDCPGGPAKIAMPERIGVACLFEGSQR